ncbi:MAG: hypothetical protein FGM14_15755 [Flavobacteriales bacterium]|nr:hypothetical protein [Flavobacteriales bacterium]
MKKILVFGIIFLNFSQVIFGQDTSSKVIILLPEPIYINTKGMNVFNSSKTTIYNPNYTIRDIEDKKVFENCNFKNYLSNYNCKDFYLFVEIEVSNLLIDKGSILSKTRSDSLEKLLKLAHKAYKKFSSTSDTTSVTSISFESFFKICLESRLLSTDLKRAYMDFLEMKKNRNEELTLNQFNLFIAESEKKTSKIIIESVFYKFKFISNKKKLDKLIAKKEIEFIKMNGMNFYQNKIDKVVYFYYEP